MNFEHSISHKIITDTTLFIVSLRDNIDGYLVRSFTKGENKRELSKIILNNFDEVYNYIKNYT